VWSLAICFCIANLLLYIFSSQQAIFCAFDSPIRSPQKAHAEVENITLKWSLLGMNAQQ